MKYALTLQARKPVLDLYLLALLAILVGIANSICLIKSVQVLKRTFKSY